MYCYHRVHMWSTYVGDYSGIISVYWIAGIHLVRTGYVGQLCSGMGGVIGKYDLKTLVSKLTGAYI